MSASSKPPAEDWAELAEYLGARYSAALAARTTELVAQEFRQFSDLEQFYRSSEAYLYDLTQFGISGVKEPYRALIKMLLPPGASLLDYGCGIGADGLRFAAEGFQVKFADFDNPSTAYLRWRLQRRGLDAPVLDVERLPAGLDADLVYCFDVLEHVPDPVPFLERLESIGSFVAVNFIVEEHSEDFPMHFSHDWEQLLERIEREHTLICKSFVYPNSQLVVYAVGKVAPDPLVSVVMPTHERAPILAQTLSALGSQTLPKAAFEALVVDDHSRDATADLLAAPPIALCGLRNEGRGPAAARNTGLAAARGALVAFLDDDVAPRPDCLEQHLLFHMRNPNPSAAALGHVEWADAEITPFMRSITNGALFDWPGARAARARGESLDHYHFYTCNLSLKRASLASERFDEAFPSAVFEDIELGYRLMREHGLALWYLPAADALHLDQKSYHPFAERQRRAGEAAVYFATRHPELAKALAVTAAIDDVALGERLAGLEQAIAALEAIAPAVVPNSDGPVPDAGLVRALEALYGEALNGSYLAGISAARARSDAPFTAAEWHREGVRRYEQGELADAARALEQSLRIEPNAERFNDLAVVVAALGDCATACRLLESSLALAPDDDDARANLAALRALASTGPLAAQAAGA